MDIETTDGKQNFKLFSFLFFSKLSSPSGTYIADMIGVACNRRFRMQSDQKGDRLPFATAPKVI
jgi:hypothetical protein